MSIVSELSKCNAIVTFFVKVALHLLNSVTQLSGNCQHNLVEYIQRIWFLSVYMIELTIIGLEFRLDLN